MSNEEINSIIEQCNKKGFAARVRDISYVLLCQKFDDNKLAYISLFGTATDREIRKYDESSLVTYLKIELKRGRSADDISFEENKAYMLKLKAQTEAAIKKGEIDKKDGLKILTDISTKLNDKFSVKENNVQQYVVVNHKYSRICQCGREIAPEPISKEEAMKMYHLVEKE